MELTNDISAEHLPHSPATSSVSVDSQTKEKASILNELSEDELAAQVETLLLKKFKEGDHKAFFQLGQLYFEQEQYGKAMAQFEKAVEKCKDFQAMFQLGVILYDGLAGTPNHAKGFELMLAVAQSTLPQARHLARASQYNVGRAYFQGYGVKQSDAQAEKYWLLSADDGNPKASIKAQTALGMFYTREETRDIKKAFFWHSEACGNGSLESQGALGVMYLHGLGTKKNPDSAFVCLREAAERGNVYAMGNLVAYYYKRKLHTKTVELASRVSTFENVEQIALETDCIAQYVAKGIALSSFYYGRCLHQGLGVKRDEEMAKSYYSKCYHYDPDMCAQLQNSTTHGMI